MKNSSRSKKSSSNKNNQMDLPKYRALHHARAMTHSLRAERAWLSIAKAETDGYRNDRGEYTHECVKELKELIERDAGLYMMFNLMFAEEPIRGGAGTNTDGSKIEDYKMMLKFIDHALKSPPQWYDNDGLVGFPINSILDYAMGTPCGLAAFLDKRVNEAFEKILNTWGSLLKTKESCEFLTEESNGWFSKNALTAMGFNSLDDFCDAFEKATVSKKHLGFSSWDDFFTRKFREGVRPLPSDCEDYIVNACESTPFAYDTDVKLQDTFWAKGQPYSLEFMFDDLDMAEFFKNGTVYQAFLSATSYHCWHSPVHGKVESIKQIKGSYYSESPLYSRDSGAPNLSQGYITEVATRAVITIKADNPNIGTFAILFIGMAEVSTCEFTVSEGEKLEAGQLIGMFHFGGSSHCMVFREGVDLEPVQFQVPLDPFDPATQQKVRSPLFKLKGK